MDKYKTSYHKLSKLLGSSTTERDVHNFLKDYPYIIRNALNAWSWNFVEVFSEFAFGSDFRADFLILSADSGAWNSILVELESPTSKPFNKDGTPSRPLAKGIAQLNEWKLWIKRHDSLFRETLSKLLMKQKVPAKCSNASEHTFAYTEIRDPRTVIHKESIVVIGRRDYFDMESQERRGLYYEQDTKIASYDRFLDQAEKLQNIA